MKGLPFVLLFTAMTFLSWGAYGPVLHHGAVALDHDSLRAFVAVGLAYFMIAVLFPFYVLKQKGETGRWTFVGTVYSFFAGVVGAVGALGIILALGYGGKPIYVMPLVFGFAPVVNTLVTAALSKTFDQIRPIFLIGIVATALGAAGVLFFKPTPPPSAPTERTLDPGPPESLDARQPNPPGSGKLVAYVAQDSEPSLTPDNEQPVAASQETDTTPAEQAELRDTESESAGVPSDDTGDSTDDSASDAPAADESHALPAAEDEASEPMMEDAATGKTKAPISAGNNVWGIVFSIVIAALCWGSYGPFLHIGQGRMDGSRLRPFACVGLAYFFVAVAVPLVLIYMRPEATGSWNLAGMSWSFAAGVAGAIGALGVILAFNAGGKPYYVMPLIFGFAPVVNTFISLTETNTWTYASLPFYLSLGVVIAGAVTVLIKAPKPKPKAAPAD